MVSPVAILHLRLGVSPLPYWIEYAPFLWGEGVDYDSDRDAYDEQEPTHWTFLDIQHRQTGERLFIHPLRTPDDPPPVYRDAKGQLQWSPRKPREEVSVLSIEGDDARSVCRAAYLTAFRSQATIFDPQVPREITIEEIAATIEDKDTRLAAANQVRRTWRSETFASGTEQEAP